MSAAQSVTVLVPGDLNILTGGYGYDRRIIAGLEGLGWTVDVVSLDASYPFPTVAARHDAARVLSLLPTRGLVLADGLAFGAMAEEAEAERQRLRFVALVHHPLATETGLTSEQASELFQSERRALACARAVVVTSHATVDSLLPYGVAAERVTVIEPGTDPRPLSKGGEGPEVHLVCVASVSPRKGHEVLIDALAKLRHLQWRLTCVGDLDRSPATVARARERVEASALSDRVAFVGERDEDEVARFYQRADLFVLPTFHEGYGMAVAEALAHGLPVVSTPTGAIGRLVGDSAGILVPAGDVDALSSALARVIADSRYRRRLTEGARARRATLPTWSTAAHSMAELLEGVRRVSERGQIGV